MAVSGVVPELQASCGQVTVLSAGKLPWTPAVVHLSPTYFASESIVGGGERYAEELSRAMSERVPVRFVSFGRREQRDRVSERYERVILRSWTEDKMTPFSPSLWKELRGARVIHCHQLNTLPTFLAAVFAKAADSAVFVSDLGGGGWTPGYQFNIGRLIRGHLPISRYASQFVPDGHVNAGVIYGGVDLKKYSGRSELSNDGTVVFLGRILPHKGVHHLIDGLPAECALQVIGPVGNADYLAQLRFIGRGKKVEYLHGLSDADVIGRLERAAVLVHPTPIGQDGKAGVSELLGLAVLEAMASNCPVIVTNAASLPELVVDGISGLIVRPNDPDSIRDAVVRVTTDTELWTTLAVGGRKRVAEEFAWSKVVERCMRAYGIAPRISECH